MKKFLLRISRLVREPAFPAMVIVLWSFWMFLRVLPRHAAGGGPELFVAATLAFLIYAVPMALVITNEIVRRRGGNR